MSTAIWVFVYCNAVLLYVFYRIYCKVEEDEIDKQHIYINNMRKKIKATTKQKS